MERFGLWVYRGYGRGKVALALSVRHRHGKHDLLLSSGLHLAAVAASRLHPLASIGRSLPIVETVATLTSLRFPLIVSVWPRRSEVGVDFVRAQAGGWCVDFDEGTTPETVVFRGGSLSGRFNYLDGDYPDEERARFRITEALRQRTAATGAEVVPLFIVESFNQNRKTLSQLHDNLRAFRAGASS